jgi:hypothetical protein
MHSARHRMLTSYWYIFYENFMLFFLYSFIRFCRFHSCLKHTYTLNKSEQSSYHHSRFMYMLCQSYRSGRHGREKKDFFTHFSILYRIAIGQPSFLHSFFYSFIHSFIHSFACLTASWIYGCVIVVLISKGEDIRTKGTHRRRSEEYPLYSTTTTIHKDNSCGSKRGEKKK